MTSFSHTENTPQVLQMQEEKKKKKAKKGFK
jgi:hypothetical protein